MSSLSYVFCVLLFLIALFNLSLTQTPECRSCCNGGSCSAAYDKKSGRCCGTALAPWCCAWTDSCVTPTRSCRPSARRWGVLTLGGLIGVIIGSVCGCCLLVTLVVFICKKMC
ncbi:unnamed protein product [Rotaria sordida]|uniref:Uncharacterized protein n=1 Tax=Rotaria sordida TaxID=392033 RepID=A0A813WUY1_9BILA|nr:unnamed protein product [Rotaria sordida]